MACRITKRGIGRRHILPTFVAVVCFIVLFDRFILGSKGDFSQAINSRDSTEINPSTKVIILSYMRSGTSLLGKLFDSNPEALYVFEPLWYACTVAVPDYNDFLYLNGTSKQAPRSCINVGIEIIDSFLNCDINNIDTYTLQAEWHLKQGKKTRDLYNCGLTRRCLEKFRQVCLESKIRATKVIRARLEDLKPLLEKYPELKVIHLVRDPRGIVQSRLKIREYYAKNPIITATQICGDMLRDAHTYKQFSVFFPNRVFQVRYEDFVSEPVKYTHEIYSFLNLIVPERTKNWLNKNMFGNGSEQHDDFETSKENPAKVSYQWRETISWNLVLSMNVKCRKILNDLLYSDVSQESQLRDRNFPLRLYMCADKETVMVCT